MGGGLSLIGTYNGLGPLSTLGHDVVSFDYSGDGVPDILLSALNEVNHRGRTYIFCGDAILPELPCFFMSGEETRDFFGYSIDCAGDVNGDSWQDFIVGAYQQGESGDPSKAYLFFGGPDADSEPDCTVYGSPIRDYFGYAVAGAGDLDGDGFGDFVVGADDAEGGLGRAYFYLGGSSPDTIPDAIVTGLLEHGHLGASAAGLGDVNGDGFDDVIVGAHSINAGDLSFGYAELFCGGESFDGERKLLIIGQSPYSMFGWSVTGTGDVNGDGYNDWLIGAKTDNAGGYQAGRAYLYFGGNPPDSVPDIIYTGEDEGDLFGMDVAAIGDIDLDGHPDIAVGAAAAGPDEQGRVYVYLGSPEGPDSDPDIILTGEYSGDEFGRSVAGTGDWNLNGLPDLIVGAKKNDEAGFNAGKIFVYELPLVSVSFDRDIGQIPAGDTLHFTVTVSSHVDTSTVVILGAVLRPDSVTFIETGGRQVALNPRGSSSDSLGLPVPQDLSPGPALLRISISDTLTSVIDRASTVVEILEPVGIDDDVPFTPPIQAARLFQNVPNPFNPSTTIAFEVPEPAMVSLSIFDVRGRTVRTLFEGMATAGRHRITWDGTDEAGGIVPSGVYLSCLTTEGRRTVRKMLLLR